MAADDFLRWVVGQGERFELVDGRIVRMMVGAKQSHNVVVLNIAAALLPQTRRGGCRTTASDTAVRTGSDGVRYPDIVVDCGPPDPNALEASKPVLVVEISSPSTSALDATDKLDEYRGHGDIALILLVEPDVVLAKLYRRDGQGIWQVEKYDDIRQSVELPEIGATLALRDVYDTLEPSTQPKLRLVEDGG